MVKGKRTDTLTFYAVTERTAEVDIGNPQASCAADGTRRVVTGARKVHRTVAGVTGDDTITRPAEPGAAATENRRAVVGRILPDLVGDEIACRAACRLPTGNRIGLGRTARSARDVNRVASLHAGDVRKRLPSRRP